MPAGGVHAAAIQRRGSVGVDVGARCMPCRRKSRRWPLLQVLRRTGRTRPRPTVFGLPSAPAGRGRRPSQRPGSGGPGGVVGSWRAARSPAAGTRTAAAIRATSDGRRVSTWTAGQAGQQSVARQGQVVQGDQGGVFQRGRSTGWLSHHAARRARQQRPDLLDARLHIDAARSSFPAAGRAERAARAWGPGGIWLPGRSGGQQQTGQGIGRETCRCPGVWACSGKEYSVAERPASRFAASPKVLLPIPAIPPIVCMPTPPRLHRPPQPTAPSAARARPGGR